MDKRLLVLIIGIFMISLVAAQEPEFVTTVNDTFDFSTDCSFNGFPCDSTYDCRFTLTQPNQVVTILNQSMTRNETMYSLQVNETDINQVGLYKGTTFCSNSTFSGNDDTFFDVTQTGKSLDSSQGFIILGLIFVLLFLTCAFLFFGNKIEYMPMKIFFLALSGLFLTVTFGFSINVIKQLMVVGSTLSGIFVGLFVLLVALVSVGFIALILFLITSVVKAFRKSRGTLDDDDLD